MSAWPRCGHPKTPESTTGRQCRVCKTAQQRERYANDPEYAEAMRERMRRQYDELDGVAYNRLLLRHRRTHALQRRRERELRKQEG